MTSVGFYSPPQLASINAQTAARSVLAGLATTAVNRTPNPPAVFNLPSYGSVPFAEWWSIFEPLILDCDAAHQLGLSGSVGAPQQPGAWSKAQSIMLAWADTNKGIGSVDNDSPLAFCEAIPAFVFADILMGTGWPNRAKFIAWLAQYFLPAADAIKTRVNNWGAWGTFAALTARHHLGQDTSGDVTLLESHLNAMIAANGQLPEEMLRLGSQTWYTYYCLVALTCAVRIVRNAGGPDLFASSRIALAITNLIAMAQNPTPATGAIPGTAAEPWPWDLVTAMAEEYDDDAWRSAAAPAAPVSYWNHHTGWNIPTLTALAGL